MVWVKTLKNLCLHGFWFQELIFLTANYVQEIKYPLARLNTKKKKKEREMEMEMEILQF